MLTEEQVKQALSRVLDPDIGIDIVSLGFIYRIEIEGRKVIIEMTLTTRGCPMHSFLGKQVEDAVRELPGIEEVTVDLVWDPPWHPRMMSAAAKERLGFSDEMME